MRFVEHLQSIYREVGNEWVNKNGIVFLTAKQEGLAIAGSIAVALGRKKAIRVPGDIDLVCAELSQARKFVSRLEDTLLKYSVYWKVQTNNRTAFCPDGCTTHFRIACPFWLPICVMVIGQVNGWRTNGGMMVQKFDDVVEAAEALDERDGRNRLTEEEPPEPIHQKLDVDLNEFDDPIVGGKWNEPTPYNTP